MYRHKKTYEIKYTDCDAYDNLKLSSLLSFLEESSCLSADELGFGYDVVSKKDMGFIIVNWYVELFRPLKLNDSLEIHTWPIRPSRIIFIRDYEIYCNGEKVGVVTARWCLVDIKNFSLLPVSAFFKEGAFDNYNTERSIDFKSWKIPSIEYGDNVYSKKVTYSDYDHYFHVNNTKYADFLLDVFSIEDMRDKFIKSAQITYVKQCKYGETMNFVKDEYEDYTLIEGRVDGEVRVQMKVVFNEIPV